MKLRKDDLLLYAITDRTVIGNRDFYYEIEMALEGGVTILQLREKNLDTDNLAEIAEKVKKICIKYDVPLIINDNLQAALKSGADGIHVGAEDISVEEIRRLTHKDFIIGATAKTIEQARLAESNGADYLGVGAVFPSPTKTNAKRITTDDLKSITQTVNIPVVAIGGITYENIHTLKNCGISGIAVISALFAENDVKDSAEKLKNKIGKIVYSL